MESISVLSSDSFLPSTIQGSAISSNETELIPLLKPEWETSNETHEALTSVACCLTMDGEIRVIAGSQDKSVLLFDGGTGGLLDKMGEHKGLVSAVDITNARSGGGVLLASVSGSNSDRRVRILKGIKFRVSGHVGFATFLPRKSVLDTQPPRPRGEGSDGESHTAHLVELYKSNQRAIEKGQSIAKRNNPSAANDTLEEENLDTPENPYGAGGAEFGHQGSVTCLTFTHLNDGTLIVVTGGTDKTIRVWNETENGSLWCVLQGHTMVVRSVACLVTSPFTPPPNRSGNLWEEEEPPYLGGGLRIASASNDEKVMIWDGDEGAWMKTLEGHQDKVTGVCLFDTKWGAEALVAISVSYDRTIKLWDASASGDGVCLLSIGGGKNIPSVKALSFAIISDPFEKTTFHSSNHHGTIPSGGDDTMKDNQGKKNSKNSHHQTKSNGATNSPSPSSSSSSTSSSSMSKCRVSDKDLRIRIVVGFRGKSVKVWDCLASPSSGFRDTVIGSEIDMPESVSDVTMTKKGDRVFVALKNGQLHCFKCVLRHDEDSLIMSHQRMHSISPNTHQKLMPKHQIMSPSEASDGSSSGGGGGHDGDENHQHKSSKFQNRKKDQIDARASLASSNKSNIGGTFPAISQGKGRKSVGGGKRSVGKGGQQKPPPPPRS